MKFQLELTRSELYMTRNAISEHLDFWKKDHDSRKDDDFMYEIEENWIYGLSKAYNQITNILNDTPF